MSFGQLSCITKLVFDGEAAKVNGCIPEVEEVADGILYENTLLY